MSPAAHLHNRSVKRPDEYPDTLSLEFVNEARCRHIEGAVFSNTEANYSRMNEPGECTLPDEPLEAIVRLPVTLARPVKELELEHQAVARITNDKVKTMKPVQPSSRPRLAVLPTIWTTMRRRTCD